MNRISGGFEADRGQGEPVAQRQEMVFGTLALLSHLSMVAFQVSRAAAPKGTKSCRTQGESVRPYDCNLISIQRLALPSKRLAWASQRLALPTKRLDLASQMFAGTFQGLARAPQSYAGASQRIARASHRLARSYKRLAGASKRLAGASQAG